MEDNYDDFSAAGGNAALDKIILPFKNSVNHYPGVWLALFIVLVIYAIWCLTKWYRGESFMPTVTASDTEQDTLGARDNQMNLQGPPSVGRQGSLFVANSQEDTSDAPLVLLPTSGSAVLASPDFNCQFNPQGGLLNPVTSDSRAWIGSALGVKETMSTDRMMQSLHGN